MSMNNEYPVNLAAPMGNIDGKMILNVEGTTLSGSLTAMGKSGEFRNGIIDAEGNISLSDEIKAPMCAVAYQMTGTFVDGRIDAVAKTKMGDIKIQSK